MSTKESESVEATARPILEIDSATGGAWDDVGKVITNSGLEDSSGLRRYIVERLIKSDYQSLWDMMINISESEAEKLRDKLQ
jgi:hypothetical protein